MVAKYEIFISPKSINFSKKLSVMSILFILNFLQGCLEKFEELQLEL